MKAKKFWYFLLCFLPIYGAGNSLQHSGNPLIGLASGALAAVFLYGLSTAVLFIVRKARSKAKPPIENRDGS